MSMAQVWLERLRTETGPASPLDDAAGGSSVAAAASAASAALRRIPRALFEYQPRPTFGRCPRIRCALRRNRGTRYSGSGELGQEFQRVVRVPVKKLACYQGRPFAVFLRIG